MKGSRRITFRCATRFIANIGRFLSRWFGSLLPVITLCSFTFRFHLSCARCVMSITCNRYLCTVVAIFVVVVQFPFDGPKKKNQIDIEEEEEKKTGKIYSEEKKKKKMCATEWNYGCHQVFGSFHPSPTKFNSTSSTSSSCQRCYSYSYFVLHLILICANKNYSFFYSNAI